MSDLSKIANQMKADWDRRIGHDYRFWMSDGHSSDEVMWKAGERDYNIITKDLFPGSNSTILDLGCGVGRLLKTALLNAGRVIGIDVSEKAIEKSRQLLGANPRLELHVGNGVDLKPVPEGSVDLVISFATLASIPTEVCASYLRDIYRVLKTGSVARLQMYVGKEQHIQRDDTLNIRCYQRDNLIKALGMAGFEVQWMEELVLPLQISFKELGLEAMIVSLKKIPGARQASTVEIAAALLPGGEPDKIAEDEASKDLEYWMTLNYAGELAEHGDVDRARATLEFAETLAKTTTIDVRDILERIQAKIEKASASKKLAAENQPPSPQGQAKVSFAMGQYFEQNMEVLRKRFPDVARLVDGAVTKADVLEVRQSDQGPVIFSAGQCLDHPEKPVAGGDVWAKRLAQEERYKNCSHAVIVGCGAGYHIESLLALEAGSGNKKISIVEPDAAVLREAFKIRDCRKWLSALEILVTGENPSLPELSGQAELWVRPQTSAVNPDVCEKLRSQFYGQRGLSLLNPTIGVAGPIQGGTQPIMEYVARALVMLGQRTHMYDMSGFCNGYHNLSKFVSDPMRRKGLENTYCEMLSQVLLESVNEKPVDILICMALAPITPRVLLELRKRGIITVLWFVEDFVRFTYWQQNAQFYDFIFTIQKGKCIEAIKAAGAGEVHYVPVACDPALHAPVVVTPEEKEKYGSPVSFMGAGYHNRQQIFASLADLPLKIWGTEWPTCRPFDRLVQDGGRRIPPSEYVKIFSASDINLNLHSSHERDGVDPFGDFLNPRTFELASAGAFQLMDERSLLSECFEPGKEIVTFRNAQELKEKIHYYMDHPQERREIANRARARALKDHTYQHRVKDMLSIIYSSRFEQIKNKLESGTWQRVLKRAKPHDELYQRCMTAFKRGEEPNLDGLVSDIVTGKGKLTETEQKLLFLFHVCKQIIRMTREEAGERN